MNKVKGQREIVLIGGRRHGEVFILNETAIPVIMHEGVLRISSIDPDTYTICQLKSGQWIGYIAYQTEPA